MHKKHLAVSALALSATILGSVAFAPGWLFNDNHPQQAEAAVETNLTYTIGSPTVQEVWVSPSGVDSVSCNQTNPCATLAYALANFVPQNQPLTTGVKIHMLSGTYGADTMPNYLENRIGTYQAPIIIQGEGPVQINGNLNIFNVKYFYLINLKFTYDHDLIHFEKGDHVLLRDLVLRNNNQTAQETLKVNQSQYVYVENVDASGAWDNNLDFVAVQYGHIVRSHFHDAHDWCAYLKGGSSYFTVAGNIFDNCGNTGGSVGGFTAGQGTGVQFMTAPWVHYEAYDIKFVNNIIHDVSGAAFGANGVYNGLFAYNTAYKVGKVDHALEFVFGGHGCDGGDTIACTPNLNAGAWANKDTKGEGVNIGNKHVYVYNNVIANPTGYVTSQWPAQFAIYGPRDNPSTTQGPNPAYDDVDLQIKGNIIWNPVADLGISGDNGCNSQTNPTCNPTQLLRDNAINTIEPLFTNISAGNYGLTNVSTIQTAPNFSTPSFGWSDIPNSAIPVGNLDNTVNTDFFGTTRTNTIAGAIASIAASISSPAPTSTATSSPSPSPTTTATATATTSPSPTTTSTATATPIPTRLADLEGYWNNVDKICSTSRKGVITCSLNSTLHPFNAGTVKTPSGYIGVYLSPDNKLDSTDKLIKTVSMKSIAPGSGISINFYYKGTVDYRTNPYLIAKFDKDNLIPESDETDNLAIYYPL